MKRWDEEYARFCASTDGHRGSGTMMPALALGLAAEAGEVAGLQNKLMRGRNYSFAEAKEELGDVLWYVTRIADEYGMTLQQLASENRAKLEARKRAGTLHDRLAARRGMVENCDPDRED